MRRVIYLAGMSRSGTTLAARLLDELPDVRALGETVHIWRRGILMDEHCGCGQTFSRCPFWQEVLSGGFGAMSAADAVGMEARLLRATRTRHIPLLASGVMPPGFRNGLRRVLDAYERLFDAAAAVSNLRAVVDSSKHASLAFALTRSQEIDLRVIHLIRDARAVAYSWTRRKPRDPLAGTFMRTQPVHETAMQWNSENAALNLLSMRVRVLRVRYETLASDPERALRAMADFAGLDVPERFDFLGFDAEGAWAELDRDPAERSHLAAGNPLRFVSGRIRITPDLSWRIHLPAYQREVVTALTWPLLWQYGYVERPGRERGTPEEVPSAARNAI